MIANYRACFWNVNDRRNDTATKTNSNQRPAIVRGFLFLSRR
ncbi:hypothetical protein rv5_gp183 [Escherichia phage V5]|uniref:Uncharacterized protein n=1 Tax=Escherichia phage V5 TaxID=399183 RepID=B3RGX2_9CAUD|nr:hypothetical protein rv5_gp183 [Escherichia phage V5]ABI79253.1 hypothetical protein [Escherichia phage V5]